MLVGTKARKCTDEEKRKESADEGWDVLNILELTAIVALCELGWQPWD